MVAHIIPAPQRSDISWRGSRSRFGNWTVGEPISSEAEGALPRTIVGSDGAPALSETIVIALSVERFEFGELVEPRDRGRSPQIGMNKAITRRIRSSPIPAVTRIRGTMRRVIHDRRATTSAAPKSLALNWIKISISEFMSVPLLRGSVRRVHQYLPYSIRHHRSDA